MPTLHAIIDPSVPEESFNSWDRFRHCCEISKVEWREHATLADLVEAPSAWDERGSGVLWDARNAGPSQVGANDEAAMHRLLSDPAKPSLIVWSSDWMGAMAAIEWIKRGATSILLTEMTDTKLIEELSFAFSWDQEKRELIHRRGHLMNRLNALTERQKRVLELTRSGLTASAIAHSLDFSQRTVELDLAAMREKMNEETTLGVVAASVEATLLSRILKTLPSFEHLV